MNKAFDEHFMRMALRAAEKAADDGEVPTGCVIVDVAGLEPDAEPTAARILADDLPAEVEGIFRRQGFDLFPGGKLGPGKYDMTSACSCPDYANPCKHVVAALLVLGEEIARRPATLLALRGIMLEDLVDED